MASTFRPPVPFVPAPPRRTGDAPARPHRGGCGHRRALACRGARAQRPRRVSVDASQWRFGRPPVHLASWICAFRVVVVSAPVIVFWSVRPGRRKGDEMSSRNRIKRSIRALAIATAAHCRSPLLRHTPRTFTAPSPLARVLKAGTRPTVSRGTAWRPGSRFPGSASGACFCFADSHWSRPFPPRAPQRLAPPCSSASTATLPRPTCSLRSSQASVSSFPSRPRYNHRGAQALSQVFSPP